MESMELKILMKKAEQGDAEAQNELGCSYFNEIEIEENYKKALGWFEKSAKQGNPFAQNNLGICYLNGKRVKENYNKARKLFEKS